LEATKGTTATKKLFDLKVRGDYVISS